MIPFLTCEFEDDVWVFTSGLELVWVSSFNVALCFCFLCVCCYVDFLNRFVFWPDINWKYPCQFVFCVCVCMFHMPIILHHQKVRIPDSNVSTTQQFGSLPSLYYIEILQLSQMIINTWSETYPVLKLCPLRFLKYCASPSIYFVITNKEALFYNLINKNYSKTNWMVFLWTW